LKGLYAVLRIVASTFNGTSALKLSKGGLFPNDSAFPTYTTRRMDQALSLHPEESYVARKAI